MKKSLLLVALLGCSGLVSAQTNVTVYGTVDAGAAYINGSNIGGRTVTLESGQQSYSRLGFKGSEDLGSGVFGRGMKALFGLEQAIRIDTGASSLANIGSLTPFDDTSNGTYNTFSSQAYVGLGSNLGTVKLGRLFTPLYEVYGEIDPFANGFAANINNFFGTDEFNVSNYQRMSNAVTYHTPDNLYGFKGALAYGFSEVPRSINAEMQFGLSLSYANGPFLVAFAHHEKNNKQSPDILNLNDKFRTNFIGGTYDFGIAKAHAAFDQNQRGDGDSFKTQDYMIGVTVPFGHQSVFADFTHKKVKNAVMADNADANQYAIGYTYNLSKRTNVYSAYTHVRNEDNSFIDTGVFGNNVNVFQVGVRHLF